jgi:cell wall-associated NlpC family hydrolase
MIALAMMDKPYRYGSQSIGQGFDCSGLVCFVYKQIGLRLPRTTAGLSQTGQKIPLSKLQPGDLVFFSMSRRGNDHVGIYIGDGRFIHAPSTGKVIRIEKLNKPYWQRHLTQARRVETYVEFESARR